MRLVDLACIASLAASCIPAAPRGTNVGGAGSTGAA